MSNKYTRVKENQHYGVNTLSATGKYEPLAQANILLAGKPLKPSDPNNPDAKAMYEKLFQNRIDLYNQTRVTLYARDDWQTMRNQEQGCNPPIIVISSHRADWIKEGYDRAESKLSTIQRKKFADVNDLRALEEGATPWYLPKRINDPTRHIYIVVHKTEYAYYQKQLQNTNMTIIGWYMGLWSISPTTGQPSEMVGFGASRLAAISLAKALNQSKAWLVDDNLVYLQGFTSFGQTEQQMNNTIFGWGFQSLGRPRNKEEIKLIANNNPVRPPSTSGKPPKTFLQQVALWNIEQFNTDTLNFSACFILSKEDLSFSDYLRKQKGENSIRQDNNTLIIKAQVQSYQHDKTPNQLAPLRNQILQYIFITESQFNVFTLQNNTPQNLATFLANSGQINKEKSIPQYPSCNSKAIEQILARVVTMATDPNYSVWVPKNTFAFDKTTELRRTAAY